MCVFCDSSRRAVSRRTLMLGAAVGIAASALPASPLFAEEPVAQTAANAISPDEALQRLVEGNARYAANAPEERDYSAGREPGSARNIRLPRS
jgi:carbonic anhydrase